MGQILFLTACVNPKGMAYTKLSNPEIRLQQYKDALDWYLENTSMKILLVENSGYDFSDCYQKQIREGRLEFICYDGMIMIEIVARVMVKLLLWSMAFLILT